MDVCRLLLALVAVLAYFVVGVATAWLYYAVRGDRRISALVCIQPIGFALYLVLWIGVVTRVYTRAVYVKSWETPGCTIEVRTNGSLAKARRMVEALPCVCVVSSAWDRPSVSPAARSAQVAELERALAL